MRMKKVVLIAERPRCRWARTLENQVRRMMEMLRVCGRCRAWQEHHLQASSYARALQCEPIGRLAHFAGHEIVTRQLPLQGDISV